MPAKTRKTGFIRIETTKEYITQTHKIRTRTTAVKSLENTLKKIIKDAAKLAKKDKRATIMTRDITAATHKTISPQHLNSQEIAREIIRRDPIELSDIYAAINKHIKKEKTKKNKLRK